MKKIWKFKKTELLLAMLTFAASLCLFYSFIQKVTGKNYQNDLPSNNSADYPKEDSGNKVLPCNFFDQQLFEKGVTQASEEEKFTGGEIKGGIIPHHILASNLMADLFSKLARQKVDTLILIGPNHYETGDFKILSSLADWKTAYGIVQPKREIINELKKSDLIGTSDQVLVNEHSISALLPFVSYYLPQTKIVPLILSRRLSFADLENLRQALIPYLSQEGTVVVASADFSHYLTTNISIRKDQETIQAIREKNYQKLFAFGSDNLDSPASVSMVLAAMDKLGIKKMKVIKNTNSAEILGGNQSSTTTYFEIIFD